MFQAATVFCLGNGESIFFWTDRWLNGSSIREIAPSLFAAVSSRKKKTTVADALRNHTWVRQITGPLTMRVLVDFDRLYDMLEDIQLTEQPDTFHWKLTADQNYSAASTYGAMFIGSSIPLGTKHIWKTSAPPRVKFFFWLVMHGRCWTGDRRFRHGLQDSNVCIICDQEAETMDHILLGCTFSREVWVSWLRSLHLANDITVQEAVAMEWWLHSRKFIPKPIRQGFDSLFFLIGWMLWKERNARTFNRTATSAPQLSVLIKEEADAWCAAGYR
jgi:hypothetical protein